MEPNISFFYRWILIGLKALSSITWKLEELVGGFSAECSRVGTSLLVAYLKDADGEGEVLQHDGHGAGGDGVGSDAGG